MFVVASERNAAPVAVVGDDKLVLLPAADSLVLDGSRSTDDDKITAFAWAQVAGPRSVTLENADRAVATAAATDLTPGVYKFQLTVTDKEGQSGKATLTVTVRQGKL